MPDSQSDCELCSGMRGDHCDCNALMSEWESMSPADQAEEQRMMLAYPEEDGC